MIYFVIFSVLFLTYCISDISAQSTRNYCSSSLCPYGRHIACRNNGDFSSYCSSDSRLVDINRYKDLILSRHNQIRNQVAGGNLRGFEPAVRMPTMVWSNELEYLASLNVKTCEFNHDECHNTDRFRNSGQNLAWRWDSTGRGSRETINSALDSWINEYRNVDPREIERFYSSSNDVLHFLLIISERNTKVGCALVQQTNGGGVEQFFACNYATTNIYNRSVYRSGRTASRCTQGTNPYYTDLCDIGEQIDVNRI